MIKNFMILINKKNPTQRIVFSSNSFNENGSFLLHITSDSFRNSIQITLTENLSNDIERCFIYNVPTGIFNELASGFYTYDILLGNEIVTSGKLLIKEVEDSNVIVLPEAAEDKEFIIYDGK